LEFYNASLLKQHSTGRHVAPFGHLIPIRSQPVFALTLSFLAMKQHKYFSLSFDLTTSRTHDLLYSMRTC